jgi:hypothetical protein
MSQMIRIADLTPDQEFLIDHLDCTGVLCTPSECPLKTEEKTCLTIWSERKYCPDLEIDWQKVMELYGKE